MTSKRPIKQIPFKELQRQWYAALKEDGFVDIEHADAAINSAVPKIMRSRDIVYQESIKEYYYMCYHFLSEYKFESKLDKTIWTYHTEGLSNREIAIILKKVRIKTNRWKIDRAVSALIRIMKTKYLST